MGRCVRRECGGIERCLILLAEHPEAVAYEVMTAGMRLRDLGSETLTWSDLATLLYYPRERGPLYRAVLGDRAEWDHLAQLLATIIDMLAGANWQRSGGKEQDRPEPYPRPGVPGYSHAISEPVADDDAYTIEELEADLGL